MRRLWIAFAGFVLACSALAAGGPAGAATVLPVGEVYVANTGSGTISQFGTDKHGVVTPLPAPSVAVAGTPSHLLLSKSGKYLYALDCGAGAIEQFAVTQRGPGKGELTPLAVPSVPVGPCVEDRLTGAQHVLVQSHSGTFVFVLELAPSGDVALGEYAVGSGGELTAASIIPTGLSGYASLLITPNGKYLYAIDGTGGIVVLSVDKLGGLTAVQPALPTLTCPTDAVITPNGKAMYIAEQCNGTLTTLKINSDGSLTLLGLNRHGCPREVAVTPDSKNLYVADPCTSVIFQYRAFTDGVLTEQIPFSVPSGTVLAMVPAPNGKFLDVTIDNGTQNLAVYPIDKHGLLVAPAAVAPTGLGSWGLAVRR